MNFSSLATSMIIFGVVLVLIGLGMSTGGKLPFIGRLPGDIFIQNGNFSFYFPLTTSILISIILSILLRIFHK